MSVDLDEPLTIEPWRGERPLAIFGRFAAAPVVIMFVWTGRGDVASEAIRFLLLYTWLLLTALSCGTSLARAFRCVVEKALYRPLGPIGLAAVHPANVLVMNGVMFFGVLVAGSVQFPVLFPRGLLP